MGVEYELKFRATEQQQAEILRQVGGQEQRYAMETTYYDTPTGAMSARRYTLRRRLENDRSVCTLKTPEQGAGRCEWEVDCDSITEALEKLCKLGGPQELLSLAAEGLVAVCGARFTRIARTLTFPEGQLELAFDRGVLTGGGKELPLCEIEVELKAGSRSFCEQYALALAQQFGLEPETKSKFRRALAQAKEE